MEACHEAIDFWSIRQDGLSRGLNAYKYTRDRDIADSSADRVNRFFRYYSNEEEIATQGTG